ncbi:MAG: hypothetical protein K8S18_13990 [Desulfobacula sp.]|nr:hypothetical protein [Desulfobacula sp.]
MDEKNTIHDDRLKKLVQNSGILSPSEDFAVKTMAKIRLTDIKDPVWKLFILQNRLYIGSVVISALTIIFAVLYFPLEKSILPEYITGLGPFFKELMGRLIELVMSVQISLATIVILSAVIILLLLDQILGKSLLKKFHIFFTF